MVQRAAALVQLVLQLPTLLLPAQAIVGQQRRRLAVHALLGRLLQPQLPLLQLHLAQQLLNALNLGEVLVQQPLARVARRLLAVAEVDDGLQPKGVDQHQRLLLAHPGWRGRAEEHTAPHVRNRAPAGTAHVAEVAHRAQHRAALRGARRGCCSRGALSIG